MSVRLWTCIALASLAPGCAESITRSDAGTDGSDAGPTVSCGGRGGASCGADAYCDYPDDICGAADGTGLCRPRPAEGCPEIYQPVCACDGDVYANACEANAAGRDVNRLGGCTPPGSRFACGYGFCAEDDYCQVVIDDTGMPPSYTCLEFPDPCDGGGRDCACVASEPCGEFCETDASGHVTVTCPGG